MGFVAGLVIGVFGGFVTLAFIQGSVKNKRESEIYNEGFAYGTIMEKRNKYKRLLAFCESRQMHYKNANENRMMFELEKVGAIKAYDEVIEKIKEISEEQKFSEKYKESILKGKNESIENCIPEENVEW